MPPHSLRVLRLRVPSNPLNFPEWAIGAQYVTVHNAAMTDHMMGCHDDIVHGSIR